jgi:hypothetical protein
MPSGAKSKNVVIAGEGDHYSYMLNQTSETTTMVRNFKSYNPSTITNIALLNGSVINPLCIHYLLPVRGAQRRANPQPGDIVSARHYSGLVRGDPGGFFLNNEMFDIRVPGKDKTVCVRVSSNKVHIVGSKSMEMGQVVSNYATQYMNEALAFIRNIIQRQRAFYDAYLWLLEKCKGRMIQITMQAPSGVSGMVLVEDVTDYEIVWPDPSSIPPEHSYFVGQIMLRCEDALYCSYITNFCHYCSTLIPDNVCTDLSIAKVTRCMVNYVYHVGFEIDRNALFAALSSLGIFCDYDNQRKPHVRVEMWSDLDDDEFVFRKKEMWENKSKQSFSFNHSGSVSHSGPGGACMEEVYYKMAFILENIRSYIEVKVPNLFPVFNLKLDDRDSEKPKPVAIFTLGQ